jgi:hypothetical protein
MATRSRTTFQKRQKEIARMEKRQEKAAKRLQRKQADREAPPAENTENTPSDAPADSVGARPTAVE